MEDTVAKQSSAATSSSTSSETWNVAVKNRGPFDDRRGSLREGGWWIDLDEAKKLGMDEEWWTETEEPTKSPVALPKASPTIYHSWGNVKYRPKGPIWLSESGTMYLGPWAEVRQGPGGRTVRVAKGIGISCQKNGQCHIGEYRDGLFHGWGRSFWLKNSLVWKRNINEEEKQIMETRVVVTGDGQKTEELVGLPYEYHGTFRSGSKHGIAGKVVLKDLTTRVGSWVDDIAVLRKWYRIRQDLDPVLEEYQADWWKHHVKLDCVPIDSPQSRYIASKTRKNAKHELPSPSVLSRRKRSCRAPNRKKHKSSKTRKCGEESHIGTETDHRGEDETDNHPRSEYNQDAEFKQENSLGAGTEVIDVDALDPDGLVPDEPPSSLMPERIISAVGNSNRHLSSQVFPDAYLSEAEESNFPLHTAVKFGDEDFVDEELEKIATGTGPEGSPIGSDRSYDSARLNAVDSKGRTALDLAALTGQVGLIKKLRRAKGISFSFKPGPRMMILAKKRSKDVAKYLEQVHETVE